MLLKYLAETVHRPTLAGLFLVTTPFWGPKFPEFALAPDFGARLRDVSPTYLYHRRDDTEVSIEHLERYRRALPQATVRVLDGRGHAFNAPTTKRLLEPTLDTTGVQAASLLAHWNRLHWIRTTLGGLAFALLMFRLVIHSRTERVFGAAFHGT